MSDNSNKSEKTGVIVVDVQSDFTELKSGSLAVLGSDAAYVEAVKEATKTFCDKSLPVYATQDWHPADHASFFTNNPGTEPMDLIELEGRPQVMWPPHCLQGTRGAELLLPSDWFAETVRKGMDSKFDSYSGFADDGGKETSLNGYLRRDGITHLIIYGLATDYCVKFTALDAVEEGYRVRLITSLCRGVAPETIEQGIEEMKDKGVIISQHPYL